jgi:hypothetical protein
MPSPVSVINVGGFIAPQQGQVLATTGVLAAGLYDVEILVGYGAVADGPQKFALNVNGKQISRLLVVPAANSILTAYKLRLRVNGQDPITVVAYSAGVPGSVYGASITATWTGIGS